MTTRASLYGSSRHRVLFNQIGQVREVTRSTNGICVRLDNGSGLELPPFRYVRVGDQLEIQVQGDDVICVHKLVAFAPEDSLPKVQLYPPYEATEIVELPPHLVTVTFRERRSEEDWRSASILEQFHYRGHGLNRLVGRRTILLADAQGIGVIGYGVLSATVAAAKPRFALFETNLAAQMRSRLINKIARIPRVVVHPEFRGLGIGTRLVKHLLNFAAYHWDINGYKPIMVEVIASMTDYHRFFQAAGFIEIGQTFGYDKPITPVYGKGTWEKRPNASSYRFFEARGPKPYLAYPLCREVRELMVRKGLFNPVEVNRVIESRSLLPDPIVFQNVSVTYHVRNGLSERASAVKDIFGVDSTQMYSAILNGFSLVIWPGDVVLITGASGSGKSTIVKLLTCERAKLADTTIVDGEIHNSDVSAVGYLSSDWDESAPLVDQVGRTLKESIFILNEVGLAEVHLYLKTPVQISDGQRYRFALARLCDSHKPLWVGDEFAATLDPYTAAVVAKGVRKLAVKYGATVVLAAPHISHFAPSLAPTQLVQLHWGTHAVVHAVKLCHKTTETGINFWAANRGRTPLTGVSLSMADTEGHARLLAGPVDLRGLAKGLEVKLSFSELNNASTIRLTSREGVGDLAYFEASLAEPGTDEHLDKEVACAHLMEAVPMVRVSVPSGESQIFSDQSDVGKASRLARLESWDRASGS